jgi:RNA polymerase sigma-70 factor (ECF subfamily)
MDTHIFLQKIKIIQPDLVRIAKAKLKVQEDIDDLMQDITLRLWTSRKIWETHQECKPLALNILRNCLINLHRKSKQMESIEEHLSLAHHDTPHHLTETKDLAHFIWECMEHLPPLQQRILRLKDIENYEVEEIEQIANLPTSAIYNNLSRARQKIRDEVIRC